MGNEKVENLVVFSLGGEDYALNLEFVREVLALQEIRLIPRVSNVIEGMINLRGYIIVVIDMRKRFNINIKTEAREERIMICKIRNFIVGLIVDSVSKVIVIKKEEIQPPPRILKTQIGTDFITGIIKIEDKVTVMLDLNNLFTQDERQDLIGTK